MKKIIYKSNIASYSYIKKVENNLLLISVGSVSPLDFIRKIMEYIVKYSKDINKEKIEIYFDLASCVGNRANRFLKMHYNKKKNELNILCPEILKENELPVETKRILKDYYQKRQNQLSNNYILSPSEKRQLFCQCN